MSWASTGRAFPTFGRRNENLEHGIIEFEDGRLGIFSWTSVGYDSPLALVAQQPLPGRKGHGHHRRRGAGCGGASVALGPGGEAPYFITLERRWERNDGGILESLVAHTGDADQPIVTWENPFRPAHQGHGQHWHDDEIGVAGCLMSLVDAVRNARNRPMARIRRVSIRS
jgi:hypothetical protein